MLIPLSLDVLNSNPFGSQSFIVDATGLRYKRHIFPAVSPRNKPKKRVLCSEIKRKSSQASTQSYGRKDKESLLRPDVGLQAQFKSEQPPKTYRYGSRLDPEISWDINPGRERAEV